MFTYPITDEQIAAARTANPGVHIERLKHPDLPDQVLARPAKAGEWSIYLNKKSEDPVLAARMLVEFCVVFPEKKDLQESLDAHPGLIQSWSLLIQGLTGFTYGATREKL